jgi:NTE family protein
MMNGRQRKPVYPFRNLVFQGGGVKAFAYLGVLPVLEEAGILGQIERVAGASAGSILATLLSMRIGSEEIMRLFGGLDYGRLSGMQSERQSLAPTPDFMKPFLQQAVNNAEGLSRLFNRYGWYSTNAAYDFIQEILQRYCGDSRATFAEFHRRGFLDLYVVATNVSARSRQVFSYRHTPNVAIADAIRLSISIPLFFEAVQFNGTFLGEGHYFSDGGILDNYPLHIFDDDDFQDGNRWHITGVNWETVGACTYTPDDCEHTNPDRPVNNLLEYIQRLMETFAEAQTVLLLNNPVDRARTILISDQCVRGTDFDTVRPDPDNTLYAGLVEAGRLAALAYLESYHPPTSKIRQWMRDRLWNTFFGK